MTTPAEVKTIIRKWYNRIGFKSSYDEEFEKALDEIYVDPEARIDGYDLNSTDGVKNFLYFLYFAEEMEKQYKDLGIDCEIFEDSLYDVTRWTDVWSELKGGLYLGELVWLWHSFTLRIIKLGRLQYCMTKARDDAPSHGIKKGDPVLDVHIPAEGPLSLSDCKKSLDMARRFFPRFFPDFDYRCFTCHSWLLDTTLTDILKPESNILAFQGLFDVVKLDPSRAILGFVLRWKITPEELPLIECKTSFARIVKEKALAGRQFYAGYGIIEK